MQLYHLDFEFAQAICQKIYRLGIMQQKSGYAPPPTSLRLSVYPVPKAKNYSKRFIYETSEDRVDGS